MSFLALTDWLLLYAISHTQKPIAWYLLVLEMREGACVSEMFAFPLLNGIYGIFHRLKTDLAWFASSGARLLSVVAQFSIEAVWAQCTIVQCRMHITSNMVELSIQEPLKKKG